MEALSEHCMSGNNDRTSGYTQSKCDSTDDKIDSQFITSGTSQVMVGNTGTSQSFLQGTSIVTNQNMLRRSFDGPSNTLELYENDPKSMSDSELEMTSYSLPDMTSEFLDLPARVSIKSHTSYRHRIDPEKLYLDLKKVKLEQSRHSSTKMDQSSYSASPKTDFTPVDVVIDTETDEGSKQPDIYLDNDVESNYDSHYITRSSTSLWINLNPPSHTLLSPRSSNGSICSYRSSNADSAIEVLTPDEEMSEHSPIELTHSSKLWDDKQKSRVEKLSCVKSYAISGAINLHSKSDNSTQKDHSTHMCSSPLLYRNNSSSHSHFEIACDSSSVTQQIYSDTTNLSSSEESSNKGREFTLPLPPSVIISDHSSDHTLPAHSSRAPLTSTGSQAELLNDPYFFHRSLSNSSISSTDSFLSIQSDSSQDVDEQPDFPVKVMKKQSSWKKIRNIVHWSPFIQQFKRRRYPWIQLAGHQGNFQAGDPGAILKKFDKKEHRSFNKLMNDVLRPYVPEYKGESEKDGDCYIQLQDLLCDFEAPCVMDIKMGVRTYLEEELSKAREKPTLRGDMYKKMIEVDPEAPTEEEHKQKAITKPRYMQWRDDMSSSTEMGFRIEGIRKSDGAQVKNFKTTKDKASVKNCLKQFVEENPEIINKYLRRLKAIRATQEDSKFFNSHEIIGSSLLFVHDKCGQASIWMIDFGKTVPLPESVSVSHRNQWVEGNHEDGYLTGIDSLVNIFEELEAEFKQIDKNSIPIVDKDSDNSTTAESSDIEDKDKDTPCSKTEDKLKNMEVDHKNNESIV